MKIPTSFKLYGQTIKVEFNNSVCKREEVVGLAVESTNSIYLSDIDNWENKLPKDVIEQAFFHEAIHHILWKSGYKELAEDEDLVNRIGNLVHQMISTFEYNLPKPKTK
jgi:hypothetical protein